MPVRRKRITRARKSAPRKTWRQYAGKALTLAGKAGIKGLKKALGLNTENKNWDFIPTPTITSTMTSVGFPTAGIAQGTTNNTRNGNGMRITHFKIRGSLSNAFANIAQQRVRIIFTYQAMLTTAGNVVTAAQLMANTLNIDSPYNSDLEGVRVIYDKTFLIAPFTTQVAQVPFKFKWDPSYDAGHVTWTDADIGGLTANLVKGALQMFIMTDTLAVATPTIAAYGRLHFVDN